MNWRQIRLVMGREYITRVKSKGFIAATLLVPLGIVAVYGIGIFIALWESDVSYEIAIHDRTEVMVDSLVALNPELYVDYSSTPVDSLRSFVQNGQINGYLVIEQENIDENRSLELIYDGSGGLTFLRSVRDDMRELFREERLRRAEVSEEVQKIFSTRIGLDSRVLTEEGEEKQDDTAFFSVIGLAMGGIIIFSIIGYGGYLTRGVIEEKTNRIIEVIASSVKPIELLIGKMLGVGSLAITQIGIWLVTLLVLMASAAPIAALVIGVMEDRSVTTEMAQQELPSFMMIPEIEISLVIYFVLFFVTGYFLYSSLFAAIGAAADSETDTQQLALPVTAPIMISYFILLQAFQNPDGMLTVVTSMVPFFAPIIMITRLAIGEVPFWQIALTLLLMVLTFYGTMLLSAKIYKVGILSYGSSAKFKDIWRWLRQ